MTDRIEQPISAAQEDFAVDARAEAEATAASDHAPTEELSEVDNLRQELREAQEEATAQQDRYLRARADMENYKKRIERTYADLAKTTKKDLLKKLLGVKDNLERALQYGDGGSNGEGVMEGVRLTQYQLDQLLQQEGVKPIEAQGQPFDPYLEEAVQSVKDESVPDHTVVQVVRTGYTYQDEVLRPAQVIVAVHEDL